MAEAIAGHGVEHGSRSFIGLQHRTVSKQGTVDVSPVVWPADSCIQLRSYFQRMKVSGAVSPFDKKATREGFEASDRGEYFRSRRRSGRCSNSLQRRPVQYVARHLQQTQHEKENSGAAHCASLAGYVLWMSTPISISGRRISPWAPKPQRASHLRGLRKVPKNMSHSGKSE